MLELSSLTSIPLRKSPDLSILKISLSPSCPYLPNKVSDLSKLGVSIGLNPNFEKFSLIVLII
jgi:hypothetical protein